MLGVPLSFGCGDTFCILVLDIVKLKYSFYSYKGEEEKSKRELSVQRVGGRCEPNDQTAEIHLRAAGEEPGRYHTVIMCQRAYRSDRGLLMLK